MPIEKSSGILRHCVCALTLVAAATVGSASLAASTSVLFEQPSESGIAKHIYVGHANKGGMPIGSWDMVALQRNPFTPSGLLVPTSWAAGSQTGFTPTSPSTAQLGFRNQAGTSTAQMEGDTVGAYINSRDLPTTQHNQLMMISPQYKFQDGATPVPFKASTSVLNLELDLQVPTAEGNNTYVNADLLFLDPRGTRISFGVKIFDNGARGAVMGTHYDTSENVYILNSPLATGQQFISLTKGSMSTVGVPWAGYRHVQFSMSQAQFAAMLKYLMAKYPGKIKSSDTTQYVLGEVHLNAEMHYSPEPGELGWSMRGLQVWETG